MSELKRTPLYDFNVAHGGRMVDFAGWEMPVQFKSIVEEHKATRSAVGLFDVSHMGEVLVEGTQALAFLDRLLANDISKMVDGQALYSLMCYDDGGVVDDLLVYRKNAECFFICLNASNTDKDIKWMASQLGSFDAKVRNVSDDYALIALQGPKTFEILRRIADIDFENLGYYRFLETSIGSARCLVSQTGYTGERGVELYVSPNDAEELCVKLVKGGEGDGLTLAGLGCRDSLRLEAGYSLYGHEISETISPVQANLMWTVKLNKAADFIGKEAILNEKLEGPSKRIVFFKTGSRRIARSDTNVLNQGNVVGRVVSGTFSPQLNEAIGSALVDTSAAQDDLAVEIRGKSHPITLSKPPFIALDPRS